MSYNANGLINNDGTITQYGNTRSAGGGGETANVSPSIMIIDKDGSMAGKTLTIFDDNGLFTYTVDFPNDGTRYINFPVDYLTVWHISYQGHVLQANVSTLGGVLAELSTIPSWSSATDEEIAQLVEWDNQGYIDLSDYWSINDERNVTISSISASGTYDGVSWSVGESQSSQIITFVLMDTNKYDLVTATAGGRTKSRFVIGVKDVLVNTGYMNSTASNTGSWDSCARRNWCNGGFRESLPSSIRGIFKQFKTPTINEGSGNTIVYSNDYFALWAEKEIFGYRTYSVSAEANALSQISYYTTSTHRIKYIGASAYYWWERSPRISNTSQFCAVNTDGSAYIVSAGNSRGITPFGCI